VWTNARTKPPVVQALARRRMNVTRGDAMIDASYWEDPDVVGRMGPELIPVITTDVLRKPRKSGVHEILVAPTEL